MKINLIFMLFLSSVYAADDAEMFQLTIYNHHKKILENHYIKVHGGDIEVDGGKLSMTETTIKAKYLSPLVTTPKKHKEKLNCSSGYFKYTARTKKQNLQEQDCLTSERYGELQQVFEAMKKNIVFTE